MNPLRIAVVVDELREVDHGEALWLNERLNESRKFDALRRDAVYRQVPVGARVRVLRLHHFEFDRDEVVLGEVFDMAPRLWAGPQKRPSVFVRFTQHPNLEEAARHGFTDEHPFGAVVSLENLEVLEDPKP